jgi:hypothetical protein
MLAHPLDVSGLMRGSDEQQPILFSYDPLKFGFRAISASDHRHLRR